MMDTIWENDAELWDVLYNSSYYPTTYFDLSYDLKQDVIEDWHHQAILFNETILDDLIQVDYDDECE